MISHFLNEIKRCLLKKEYFFRNYILRKYITINPEKVTCCKHGEYESGCMFIDVWDIGKCIRYGCSKCSEDYLKK